MGPLLALGELPPAEVGAGAAGGALLLGLLLLRRPALLRLEELAVAGVGSVDVTVHGVVVAAVTPGRGVGAAQHRLRGDEIRRLAAGAVEVARPARAVPIPRGPDAAAAKDLAPELRPFVLERVITGRPAAALSCAPAGEGLGRRDGRPRSPPQNGISPTEAWGGAGGTLKSR